MTREEFITACGEFFEFSLKSAFRCRAKFPEETLSQTLEKHTLFTYALRSSAGVCREYPPEAVEFLRKLDRDPGPAAAVFRTVLPRIAAANYEGAMRPSTHFAPGMSLYWTRPVPELPPTWCIFHIRNGIPPKSFLNEPDYFAGNLLRIMDEAEKDFPCDTIYTFTWLNSEPRFLRFFADEWQENLGEPPPGISSNIGFLGQFINARGGLNRRTAEQFLETGELPFKPRRSHCSCAAMREYLNRNFPHAEKII